MNINRIIISGCTDAGCTNVLSQQFTTPSELDLIFIIFYRSLYYIDRPGSPSNPSLTWIVVFPILVVLVIAAALALWKRRPLKQLINSKLRNGER
jgi:hypothetical protein